jgi:hypothetical protein
LVSRVFHTGHASSTLKILLGGVAAFLSLSGVVDQEFVDFTQTASCFKQKTFFAEVDDGAYASSLRGFDRLLDAEG